MWHAVHIGKHIPRLVLQVRLVGVELEKPLHAAKARAWDRDLSREWDICRNLSDLTYGSHGARQASFWPGAVSAAC